MIKTKNLYGLMALGGSIGLIASFMQTLEKLQLLKNAADPLVCDLSSVFSCTNVLRAWQSSVFGFPNSLMCMVFFTIFMTAGLAGWSGGQLAHKFRLAIHGLAVFVLLFGVWFLWQSTYSIGALCLYCLFCFSGLMLLNFSWLRINSNDLKFLGPTIHTKLQTGIKNGADIFGWLVLAFLIAFLMLLKFY